MILAIWSRVWLAYGVRRDPHRVGTALAHRPAGRVLREHPLACAAVTNAADPLAPLAELPGVAEAGEEARDALGRAHRHRANLRGWPETAAEAALRAARASSVLDGGSLQLSGGGRPDA